MFLKNVAYFLKFVTLKCFSLGGNYYRKTNSVSRGTKMGLSYANLFVGLSNTNFSVNTTALNLNSKVVTLTTASALPPLPERSSLNL